MTNETPNLGQNHCLPNQQSHSTEKPIEKTIQQEKFVEQRIEIDFQQASKQKSVPELNVNSNKSSQNASIQKPKNISEMISAMKDEIMAKIVAHNRNQTNELQIPAPSIHSFIKMLQRQFPKLRIDLIMKSLHNHFHANCKQLEDLDDESFRSISEEFNYSNTDYSKANILVRQREAVRIPTEARLTQEKRIAISYLNHGYGVRILRQFIKDPNINPTRYNNVITTIMKLAFRRLQDFIKNTGHAVQTINSQDQKVIRAPLTNCQKWLPPDELETFYKFIKLACNLQSKVDIFPGSAVKLYYSCIRQLRQRQANQQDYRNEKAMRGARRMPRVTQNMYNNIAQYNQSMPLNASQSAQRMSHYPGKQHNSVFANQRPLGKMPFAYNKQNSTYPQIKSFWPYNFNFNQQQTASNHFKGKPGQRP